MHEGPANAPRDKFKEAKETLEYSERRAIAELMLPASAIMRQLAPELINGEYHLIVGDDISGRIPAVILNEAIKKVYKAHGHEAPILRFVAGGRRKRFTESIDEELERKRHMFERVSDMRSELLRSGQSARALIVTDTIHQGEAMKLLLEGMRRGGISADIASMGYVGEKEAGVPLETVEKDLRTRIVVGAAGLPSIYVSDNKYLQGVVKGPGSATSQTFVGSMQKPDERGKAQEHINAARVLAMRIGSDLGDSFLENIHEYEQE